MGSKFECNFDLKNTQILKMNFKTIYLTAYLVIVVAVAFLVNRTVKKEYMDEIFHVEMSKRYLDCIYILL